MSKPVLVGYDPRKGDRAPVDFGVAMARLSGAPLVLAFVQAAAAAEGFSAGSKLYGVGQVDEDLVAVLGRLVQRASRARARQLPALEPDARRLLLRFDLLDRRRAYEAQIAEACAAKTRPRKRSCRRPSKHVLIRHPRGTIHDVA